MNNHILDILRKANDGYDFEELREKYLGVVGDTIDFESALKNANLRGHVYSDGHTWRITRKDYREPPQLTNPERPVRKERHRTALAPVVAKGGP